VSWLTASLHLAVIVNVSLHMEVVYIYIFAIL